jgi:xanthine/uracil/vitamin C permease (AzgA family)
VRAAPAPARLQARAHTRRTHATCASHALTPHICRRAQLNCRLRPGVFFSTALASGIFTFMMGLLVNVPVALAPGMGCVAPAAHTHALTHHTPSHHTLPSFLPPF